MSLKTKRTPRPASLGSDGLMTDCPYETAPDRSVYPTRSRKNPMSRSTAVPAWTASPVASGTRRRILFRIPSSRAIATRRSAECLLRHPAQTKTVATCDLSGAAGSGGRTCRITDAVGPHCAESHAAHRWRWLSTNIVSRKFRIESSQASRSSPSGSRNHCFESRSWSVVFGASGWLRAG